MNLQYFFSNAWRWACGMPENNWQIDTANVEKSEWSADFETYMKNRLIMGALRYGKLHDRNKKQYDRISSAIKRLQAYNETGNKEMLVDVANLCLLEFEEGIHPNSHFNPLCDSEHVNEISR